MAQSLARKKKKMRERGTARSSILTAIQKLATSSPEEIAESIAAKTGIKTKDQRNPPVDELQEDLPVQPIREEEMLNLLQMLQSSTLSFKQPGDQRFGVVSPESVISPYNPVNFPGLDQLNQVVKTRPEHLK